MKIKMRRKEVFDGERSMPLLAQHKMKAQGAILVTKNRRIMVQEADDTREGLVRKLEDDEKERETDYDSQLDLLNQEYAVRDVAGKVVLLQDGTPRIGDVSGYRIAKEELNDDFGDVVKARSDWEQHATDFLLDTIELEVHEMPKDLMPKHIEPAAIGPFDMAMTGFDIADLPVEEGDPEED